MILETMAIWLFMARTLMLYSRVAAIDHGTVNVILNGPGVQKVENARISVDALAGRSVCFQRGDRNFVCDAVSYGWHVLTVEVAGFRMTKTDLRVYSPTISAHVRLDPSDIDGTIVTRLSGLINGDHPEGMWIKALPVEYGASAIETSVSGDAFELRGLDVGQYVFTVLTRDTNNVVCVQPLFIGADTRVQVHLRDGACAVVVTVDH